MLFSILCMLEYSTRWQPSIWGDRLLRLGLRLSPNLFWNIVYVYTLAVEKKGRITFFSVQSIYIEYTFCKQNGEKTLNLSAAVTKVNCLPVYDVITAN